MSDLFDPWVMGAAFLGEFTEHEATSGSSGATWEPTLSRYIAEHFGNLGFGGPRGWVHHPHVRLDVNAFVPLTVDLDRHQRT
jgi:hypothetical protein